MADYVSPDARRRIATGLMAAQYAENPPTAPMGYDFDAAPLSPGLMNFAAQRGQPGVIQKTIGLIPGFDQDGKRGAQSWGNALMSTAQFPIDAVAGIGQAITAPARAYRGEFDPVSEEGVGEALNVAGNAMLGGFAAPKPRNVVGSAGGELKGAALGAIPDMPPSYVSRANAQPPQPLFTARGYHGTGTDDLLRNPFQDSGPWGSSSPRVAETYSKIMADDVPSILPLEYRFSNPQVVDAGGRRFGLTTGRTSINTDVMAARAREAGHDGIVFNNIRDAAGSDLTQASTYAPLQPGTTYSATTGDLLYANGGRPGATAGAALGAIPDTPGIRAYHGSPHDFDRFDMSKIGTGEGAQAFGHGLYFAENEGVARSYRESLKKDKKVNSATDRFNNLEIDGQPLGRQFDIDTSYVDELKPKIAAGEDVRPFLAEKLSRWEGMVADGSYPFPKYANEKVAAYRGLIDRLNSGGSLRDAGAGRMYEVNIKANPDDFLDWDKPLSQQSEKVRGALAQYGIDRPDWTGGQVYESNRLVPGDFADKKQAAQRLKDAGIAGVRYLDQGSRAGGEGSRNLAVFDDKLIEILRKYGLLGMAGGAAAAEYGFGAPQSRPASPQYRPGDA